MNLPYFPCLQASPIIMEDLQRKHRQEQKDLQSRIMQKKKSATKKTRKGVNDECAELERQLKEGQTREEADLAGNESKVEDVSLESPILDDTGVAEQNQPSQDLSQSLNSLSVSTALPANGHVKRPNRQKARLARRAAEQEAAVEEAREEAANLPDLREKERALMREAYTSRGLKEQEIRSDGHCLYAAVADQLIESGAGLEAHIDLAHVDATTEAVSSGYKTTRQVAASYMFHNSDDFSPFLEEPLGEYVETVRNTGEWGGHLEILALAKAYSVDIKVLQGDGRVETVSCGTENAKPPLWLSYYRHSYGLGEHYNSLRQAKS